MSRTPDEEGLTISRRELLRRAGIVGAAAAAVPASAFAPIAQTLVPTSAFSSQAAPLRREALETLTTGEGEALEAIVSRLIPSDELGPGAAEARAARYIDRALGGALASSRETYRDGLRATDSYAQFSKGAPFARLSVQDQDNVLRDMENNLAPGFVPNAATFFNLVRAHTIQGTFGDPHYGGNANFVGWVLINYPGLRLAVAASDQRLNASLMPIHRSAYEYAMFSKKRPARASLEVGMPHGG